MPVVPPKETQNHPLYCERRFLLDKAKHVSRVNAATRYAGLL
jgi:hypothetical protein